MSFGGLILVNETVKRGYLYIVSRADIQGCAALYVCVWRTMKPLDFSILSIPWNASPMNKHFIRDFRQHASELKVLALLETVSSNY